MGTSRDTSNMRLLCTLNDVACANFTQYPVTSMFFFFKLKFKSNLKQTLFSKIEKKNLRAKHRENLFCNYKSNYKPSNELNLMRGIDISFNLIILIHIKKFTKKFKINLSIFKKNCHLLSISKLMYSKLI